MKTSITQAERLQLIGLLTLAKHHNDHVEEIKSATLKLLDIPSDDGTVINNPAEHVSDAVYLSRGPDELLRLLSIEIEE